MAFTLYDNFRLSMMNGTAVNFGASGDTIKVAIATASYAYSQANDDFFNDVTNEVSGTNYSAGGSTLASKTLTLSAGTVTFDAADVTISQNAAGFTNGRVIVVYKSTGTGSTSPLIGFDDRGASFGNVAGDVLIQWNALGLITAA